MRWENLYRVNPAPGFIAPCLPTVAARVPMGPLWIHEVKHDGSRLLVRKSAGKVCIYTRRGADWTRRFPSIVEGASRLQPNRSTWTARVWSAAMMAWRFLRSCTAGQTTMPFLYAFDLLEVDEIDLRPLPLKDRKRRLQALLSKKRKSVYNEHLKGDGEAIFAHACKLGCEGIVSKRRDLPYRSGRAKSWLKIKNPNSPAVLRIEEGTF